MDRVVQRSTFWTALASHAKWAEHQAAAAAAALSSPVTNIVASDGDSLFTIKQETI